MKAVNASGLLLVTGVGGGGGGGLTNINVSAGTTSNLLSAITFSDGSNVSFGLNASTITASVNTSLTNIRVSAGTTSNLLSAITFSDSNGLSFGINASTLTGSYTVPTVTNSSWTASDNATSLTIARLAFTNLNNVTLSLSTTTGGSATLVGSITAQSAQTMGGYFVGNTVGESSSSTKDLRSISIQGDGIVSAGWSNSSIRISATQSNQAFSAAGGSSAFQTLSFSDNAQASWTNNAGQVALTDVRASLFAVGNTTQSSSGTQNIDALSFRGDGVASVGVTNGSVVVSVPSGGGGLTNIRVSAGTTSNLLSDMTFADSNGVSFGINASTITASVAGGAGPTLSFWDQTEGLRVATIVPGNGSVLVWPVMLPANVTASRWKASISVMLTTSSNSSHGGSLSFNVGIFTRNVNTLSLASTGSTSYAWTNTSNNSNASLSGLREISGTFDALNLTAGAYWFAVWSRTSTVNANWFVANNVVLGTSQSNSTHLGHFVSAVAAASFQPGIIGQGTYSATSTTMPVSMAFSDITGTARWWIRPHLAFVNFQA